jgi:hypothetical protein
VVECPELGFGDVEAAEGPLAADEVVDQGAGFGGGGMVVFKAEPYATFRIEGGCLGFGGGGL